MALNRNNFLRWNGTFTKAPYTIDVVDIPINFYANEDSISLNPSSFCSASLGLNTYSFFIEEITLPLVRDCGYDGTILTIYRPIDILATDFYVKYRFRDNSGNLSDLKRIHVSMSAIFVSWIAYSVSAVCTLDSFGNNTGYLSWTQLILVNSGTMAAIIPLTLKANAESDADYVSPITDITTCPTVGSLGYSYLFISNFTKNGSDPLNWIIITNIYIYSATFGVGGTPLTINQDCNIDNGQTLRMFIPAGTWDNIAISYNINGVMATAIPLRYWLANLNGVISGFGPSGVGITDNPVDDSGILSNPGITVPVSSTGITIFAR